MVFLIQCGRHPKWMAGSPGGILRQIIESTRQYINAFDPAYHVSTYAERAAMRILEQSGSIYITGKSGSGKTRTGISILAAMSNKTNRIPMILTSAKHWNYIPQKKVGKERYIIMIDDIFGSCNLVSARVDEWSRQFDMMCPSVESGHVLLVLVSRSGIGAHQVPSLRKYKIMQNTSVIDLDEGPYSLRNYEKVKLVRKYTRATGAEQEDIQKKVGQYTALGFPQCCAFFHTIRHTHVKGIEFLKRPYEFIAEEVKVLKETDHLGYYVLLIIIMMNNSLDRKLLSNPTVEFNQLREHIRDACTCFTSNPSCQKIQGKADSLSGTYLSNTNQRYTFSHQSIFEAVLLNAAEDNKELFLQYCPIQTLLEFVSLNKDCSNICLCIEEDDYNCLVSRITDIILSDGCHSILSHAALRHPRFLEYLSDTWDEDTIFQISNHAATPQNVTLIVADMNIFNMFSDPLTFFGSNFLNEEVIFTYKYAVSFFIMQKLSVLVKLVLHSIDNQKVHEEALNCALYMQDRVTIDFLLGQKGTISLDCMTIICCIRDADQRITNDICRHFEAEHECPSNPEKHLSLAVRHGNIRAVEFLVKNMSGLQNCGKIYFRCLEQLLFQCDRGCRHMSPVSSSAIPVLELMTILLSIQTTFPYQNLLLSASAHDTSLALECLLNHAEASMITPDIEEVMENAALNGITDNLNILLKKEIRFKKTILLNAAKSQYQSGDKTTLLLEAFRKAAHSEEQLQGNQKQNDSMFGVNMEDENKNSPLHLAALRGDADCVGVLLQAGADSNHMNKDGVTPLQCATLTGSTECIRCFMQTVKGQIEVSDPIELVSPAHIWHDGSLRSFPSLTTRRFLMNSTGNKPKALLDLLLGKAMSLETPDEVGRTPMFYATLFSDLPLVKHLSRLGARLDVQDCNGRTVLHEAARNADFETFMFLCESAGEIDVKTFTGQTVVHEAAESRDDAVEKLKYLLSVRNVSLTCDDEGRSPLFNAVHTDDIEVVGYLVTNGLRWDVSDKSGMNLLHESCLHGSIASFQYLLTLKQLDVNAQTMIVGNHHGNTALHFAICSTALTNSVMVAALIEHGADVHISNSLGRTPLHEAAQIVTFRKFSPKQRHEMMLEKSLGQSIKRQNQDVIKLVQLVLDKSVDINNADNAGDTALHLSLKTLVNSHLTKLLLDKGACVHVKGCHGETPLHCAVRCRCSPSIIELLLEKGSDPNARDDQGRTTLHLVVVNVYTEIVKVLVKHGVDLQAQDKDGNTVLHHAALNAPRGRTRLMEVLVATGVNPHILNKDGKSAYNLTI